MDGYYTRSGEYLCVAYPGYSSISFTAANTGLPKDLLGLEGHKVTISMKQKEFDQIRSLLLLITCQKQEG